ncbi:MAG: DUF6132 family protein [Bacteroidota bacterium]
MKRWLSEHKLYLLGILAGGLVGYLYWRQVGCSSGTCMITSMPLNSTLYGALMGALLFGMFKKESPGTNN